MARRRPTSFDVGSGGTSFGNAHFGAVADCQPDARFYFSIDFPSTLRIQADGTFAYDVGGGELAGSYIHGSVATDGTSKGVMHVKASFDYQGTHYNCDTSTNWTAKVQH